MNFSLDLLGQHIPRAKKVKQMYSLIQYILPTIHADCFGGKKLDYDTTRILSLNNISPLNNGLIVGKRITVFSGVFNFHLGCLLPLSLFSPLLPLYIIHE